MVNVTAVLDFAIWTSTTTKFFSVIAFWPDVVVAARPRLNSSPSKPVSSVHDGIIIRDAMWQYLVFTR